MFGLLGVCVSPTGKGLHGQLPATINPVELAEQGARLSGTLPLKSMSRLMQACLGNGGEAQVDLHFGRAEIGNVLEMTGTVGAAVRVACQRCLEPMELELRTETRLLLLRAGEREESLSQEVDALVADRPLSLNQLVEDELLLVMPMIPLHPLARCPAREHVEAPGAVPKAKPLSTLGRLKRT